MSPIQTERGTDDTAPSSFVGHHHARFHDPEVVYHVISRTFQGALLLTPGPELNDLIAGVLGRAQELYSSVRLYAYAFMSNHFHLMLQGPAEQIPAFVGFLKGEVSRRWAPRVNWEDGLWASTYLSTALPSTDDQLRCLEYILSQGVKEGLVASPESWPGVHVAKQLLAQMPLVGGWLDGTAYAKAKFKDDARRKPRGVARRDFIVRKQVRLDALSAWSDIDPKLRSSQLAAMRDRIIEAGRRIRKGKAPLGSSAVMRLRPTERRRMPKPPWWEERRRFICWADPTQRVTKEYLRAYWIFQRAFREASMRYLAGDDDADFPAGAFRPGRAAA